ncbi:hypothetical protein, partial [Sphingopyxis sp.]|uniref:hypothetical protein n=1 Tax=Sphingopyxis sp. TaxID=1908224 RepID=UPI002ED83D48
MLERAKEMVTHHRAVAVLEDGDDPGVADAGGDREAELAHFPGGKVGGPGLLKAELGMRVDVFKHSRTLSLRGLIAAAAAPSL